jgi:ElaB/YqjD/DUF883 family membrane-anchored ribosome-binding protein
MDSGQKSPEPEEVQRQIVETREELGDTVEALAQKANVKARTKKKVAEAQETVKAKVGVVQGKTSDATPDQAKRTAVQAADNVRERPLPAIAMGAFVSGVIVGWLLTRR